MVAAFKEAEKPRLHVLKFDEITINERRDTAKHFPVLSSKPESAIGMMVHGVLFLIQNMPDIQIKGGYPSVIPHTITAIYSIRQPNELFNVFTANNLACFNGHKPSWRAYIKQYSMAAISYG